MLDAMDRRPRRLPARDLLFLAYGNGRSGRRSSCHPLIIRARAPNRIASNCIAAGRNCSPPTPVSDEESTIGSLPSIPVPSDLTRQPLV